MYIGRYIIAIIVCVAQAIYGHYHYAKELGWAIEVILFLATTAGCLMVTWFANASQRSNQPHSTE
ncbi:MAG: hypothetical protein WCF77_03540 [Minisyncoccia bacterium]|jgi:type IV secretory pathway VirB2 component (pilin)